MIRWIQIIFASCLVFLFAATVSPQTYNVENNPSYGPGPKNKPRPVAKRLSYENFRNIRLLHTALMNYGGKDVQIDNLVDQYAEASALYFQNKIKESAELFRKNEQAILKAAQEIAAKYNKDSVALLHKGTKMKIKGDLKMKVAGKKENEYTDKYLNRARASVQRANDFYVRYKDASNGGAYGLIRSIYYYRNAKSNIFQMFKVMDMSEEEKESLMANYKKDIVDSKNTVYKTKQKEN